MVRTWIRERVVDHLAHIDTKLAEAVGANLGIELSDDQRNITLPAPVNGVEKDPSLSLYADTEGDVKGRVVAVLLNERTSAQDLVQLLQALQAQGVHSKLLYSRMGEVIADDGSPLPIAGTFAGSPSLTVDAVVVPGGDLSALSQSGDARYYLLEAYKHLLKLGFTKEYGAREMDRAIASHLKPLLMREILFGTLKTGGKVEVTAENGQLSLQVLKKQQA